MHASPPSSSLMFLPSSCCVTWQTDSHTDAFHTSGQSICDVEALKKCLERTNGDHTKCEAELAAFRRTCERKVPSLEGSLSQSKAGNK